MPDSDAITAAATTVAEAAVDTAAALAEGAQSALESAAATAADSAAQLSDAAAEVAAVAANDKRTGPVVLGLAVVVGATIAFVVVKRRRARVATEDDASTNNCGVLGQYRDDGTRGRRRCFGRSPGACTNARRQSSETAEVPRSDSTTPCGVGHPDRGVQEVLR